MWVMLFKMSPQDIIMWMMILKAVWPVFFVSSIWVAKKVVNYIRVVEDSSSWSTNSSATRIKKKQHMLRLKYPSTAPWKLRHVVGPQRDVTVQKHLHISWRTRKTLEKARKKNQAWKRLPSHMLDISRYQCCKFFKLVGSFFFDADHGDDACKKDDYDEMPDLVSSSAISWCYRGCDNDPFFQDLKQKHDKEWSNHRDCMHLRG